MYKRGQVGMESIILFGVLIVFLTAILYVSVEIVSYNYRISQLQDAVDMITLSADQVGHLARGSTELVRVYLPKGIRSATVTGNTLAVDYTARGETANVVATTESELVGGIPTESGQFAIEVTSLGNSLVKIGDYPHIWRLEPSTVAFTTLPQMISIYGLDFTPESVVKINGLPYPSGFTYYQSPSLIQFDAITGHLPPVPPGTSYLITVADELKESNALLFTVTQAGNQQNQ